MAITNKTLKAMLKHAEQDYPNEACGLGVRVGRAEVYVPCKNLSNDPTEQFKLCPQDYAEAEELGDVIGVFHSHPDGTSVPSRNDIACMSVNAEIQRRVDPTSDLIPWHIVSWPEGDYREVMPSLSESLLGKPFVHGFWDCWQTCNDYYQKYHNIEFPKYERKDDWWEDKDAVSLYETFWPSAGFEDVTGQELKPGDMIVMQVGRSYHPNHAGIYLGKVKSFEGRDIAGDGPFMLHHMYGQESSVVIFGGQWQQRTRLVLRHKEVKSGGKVD